ncbi:MAG: hypothetical protein MJH11_13235, partial [Lentisphaeria bacterium]|nr:hypothetical protein [Lentisphaeria bacterium]
MSLAKFGNATPTQMFMLELAGWKLNRGESLIIQDETERILEMCRARLCLVYHTRQDYRFELAEWR